MKTCIYCRSQNQSLFKGVEHLIPQSFGTFSSETPTLKCVCDECNAFFAKELDQILARDSWEGVERYKKGIKSREQRPIKRLKFSLENTPEMGEFGGMVFEGVDATTGKLLHPKGQFHIKNIKTKKFDVFFTDAIKNIKLDDETYGVKGTRETKIFANSEEEHQAVFDEVRKIIPTYKIKEKFQPPFIQGRKDDEVIELPIWIEGTIDHPIKRGLIKILLNFSAYYIGNEEVLKSEWDKARDYVRLNSEPILGKADTKPFWGDETEVMRLPNDSFNILVENKGKDVIGKIQIYNFYTHTFILAENHSIPIGKEKAMRFTKGKPPYRAEKRTVF